MRLEVPYITYLFIGSFGSTNRIGFVSVLLNMADGETCGCKGVRSCLICEREKHPASVRDLQRFRLCIFCGETVVGSRDEGGVCDDHANCSEHIFPDLRLKGVTVIENFVTEEEENMIVTEIDKTVWSKSQSGRRKQDYGPQVNFKKKKLKATYFNGLPSFSQIFVQRMWSSVPELSNFKPVELCNLDYAPERGSSIDPHYDDFWLWGERLVTMNLLSSSILTFTDKQHQFEVAVPMPQRSLIVVQGSARYEWKHAIKRGNITGRRIAITLRELSKEFSENGEQQEIGSYLLERALSFQGQSVQMNMESCAVPGMA